MIGFFTDEGTMPHMVHQIIAVFKLIQTRHGIRHAGNVLTSPSRIIVCVSEIYPPHKTNEQEEQKRGKLLHDVVSLLKNNYLLKVCEDAKAMRLLQRKHQPSGDKITKRPRECLRISRILCNFSEKCDFSLQLWAERCFIGHVKRHPAHRQTNRPSALHCSPYHCICCASLRKK